MKFSITYDLKNNSDYVLKKYEYKITPGEKSVEELIDFLKGKVDIAESAITELFKSIFEHIIQNAVHGILNQKNLTANELNFIVYKVLKNNRSNSYYQSHVRIVDHCEDATIYVVFEKRTGSIYSNNNKLFLELSIERGVSQYDFDNDTSLLKGYLFYVDSYFKGEY